MITTTCNQYTARQWFTLRSPLNLGIVFVGFVALVFVLQNLMSPFIADAICVSLAFCAYFFVLDKRAIAIVCPHCEGYIETNTPWKCGNINCQKDNEQVNDFPIVYHCQHCGVEQKAFECPHPRCYQPIFLGKDKLKTIYATFMKVPEKIKLKPARKDPDAEKVIKQREEKHDLEHELELTRLKGDLKDAKSKIEPIKIKTVKERLQSRVLGKTELDDEVRRMKADIDSEFKDDPVEREKRHRILDDEARELL